MATASAEAVEKIPEWLRDNGEEIEVVKQEALAKRASARGNVSYRSALRFITIGLESAAKCMREDIRAGRADLSWWRGAMHGYRSAIVSLRIAFGDWSMDRMIGTRRVEIDPDALAAVAC